MASDNGPDLTGARIAVEALMDDSCTVASNVRGDDVFDPVTGSMTSPPGASIYDATTTGFEGRPLADEGGLGGKCKTSPATQSDIAQFSQGEGIDAYRIGLPWDAPLLPIGSVVTFTSSRRDPELVGQEYEILRAYKSTFLVSRRYLAAMKTPVPT